MSPSVVWIEAMANITIGKIHADLGDAKLFVSAQKGAASAVPKCNRPLITCPSTVRKLYSTTTAALTGDGGGGESIFLEIRYRSTCLHSTLGRWRIWLRRSENRNQFRASIPSLGFHQMTLFHEFNDKPTNCTPFRGVTVRSI